MATRTTIPVTIDPETATLIADLRMEGPFREMLEHSRYSIANLNWIEVDFESKVDEPNQPTIHLICGREGPDHPEDPACVEWDCWAVENYPPDIHRHFVAFFVAEQS